LKSIKDVDFSKMTIHVVNETPGSRREVRPGQLAQEIRRMGGERLADALDARRKIPGSIEPVADPRQSGDWHAVPEAEATIWTFWPEDEGQPAEHFYSRAAAERYQQTGERDAA
jgi:hypothetical protein